MLLRAQRLSSLEAGMRHLCWNTKCKCGESTHSFMGDFEGTPLPPQWCEMCNSPVSFSKRLPRLELVVTNRIEDES